MPYASTPAFCYVSLLSSGSVLVRRPVGVIISTITAEIMLPPMCPHLLSPDGLRAAVGHDALISYVNMEQGTVRKQFNVPTIASGIITAQLGQAVAVNLDGTICDSAHPAAPGSYIIVYFTGGGPTTPFGSTGSVTGTTLKRLTQTALATVADVPATVIYAGAAPTLVEGVSQLNLRLDEKTPASPAQTLILTVGNTSSPATASIAVK